MINSKDMTLGEINVATQIMSMPKGRNSTDDWVAINKMVVETMGSEGSLKSADTIRAYIQAVDDLRSR